jgi:hypothetical protein
MMKKVYSILVVLILLSCDSENGSDCLKTSGADVTKNYTLSDFSKVIVHEGIELEIKQGVENGIQIRYGKNLINDIYTVVDAGQLVIGNNTTCNLIRDYEPAKVTLTAVDITEIRNASQFPVFSTETIRFNALTLISEDFFIDVVNVGDFNLKIENQNLEIISNNVSNFTISGSTENLFVGFYSGQGKFNGELLVAQNVGIFHRGINTMTVNPIEKITGEIRGAGNVIAVSKPPIVDVKEYYTGKLIFR